jgi:hypothetical protein
MYNWALIPAKLNNVLYIFYCFYLEIAEICQFFGLYSSIATNKMMLIITGKNKLFKKRERITP